MPGDPLVYWIVGASCERVAQSYRHGDLLYEAQCDVESMTNLQFWWHLVTLSESRAW